MAGRVLFVVFIYSFHKIQVQALLPPTLTVNPSVITETDSVTLNCQTPSSVSLSQCYFHIVRGGPAKRFSCLQTLTGTELLKITNQSPPAEVKVTCFYIYVSLSPDSDVSSIIVRKSLPPKLTVNPAVIKETDSVTLDCQTPSVSVSQCFFYTLSGGTIRDSSCLKTLRGTELLKLSHQSSPAEVQVLCFYTVKLGELDSPSPHSDTSSITIHSQTPQMTLQHFPGNHVLFTCSLPGSANHNTRCNLYFGEASHPVITTTIGRKRDPETNQWFCQFTVTIDDLVSRLRLLQQSDASCDYSLGSESNSLSPRSDGYSLIDIVDRESSMTQTIPAFTVSTALTVSRPRASSLVTPVKLTSGWTVSTPSSTVGTTSTSLTPEKPTSETDFRMTEINLESGRIWIRLFLVIMAGCGVTVGVILLVSAILWNRRRAAGSEEVKRQKHQNENVDTYHLYYNISEEAAASTLNEKCVSKRPNAKVSGKSQDDRDYMDCYGETYSIVTYKCNTGEDAKDGRSD